jgi:hypothetical protein
VVLEDTHIAQIVRPFSTRRSTEIVAAPKVYGFDTGFVCYYKGRWQLRPEDMGLMWEHQVLNEIRTHFPEKGIHYWRDKGHHEIDFVIVERGAPPIAIECKRTASNFSGRSLAAFRRAYPSGANYVTAPDVSRPYKQTLDGNDVMYAGIEDLMGFLRRQADG